MGSKKEESAMSRRYSQTINIGAAAMLVAALVCPAPAFAEAELTGAATEFTQLLNNGELVDLVGQSGTQITNQVTQISQLAEQIENQLQIYRNMLQNTAQLPEHTWGQVEQDLSQLQSVVNQGQGIAFSAGNIDDLLRQRFQSFANFQSGLPDNQSFSSMYQNWSSTNRDTVLGTLKAAGLTADQFSDEQSTMAQLQTMSESADGQLKALQVGHEIAAQQVAQMQKLRGLVAQQTTMMGTWYQSQQAEQDLSEARRQDFFKATTPSTSGGQTMEPRW
jgi:P-type conjugative transfer protein TrbJ